MPLPVNDQRPKRTHPIEGFFHIDISDIQSRNNHCCHSASCCYSPKDSFLLSNPLPVRSCSSATIYCGLYLLRCAESDLVFLSTYRAYLWTLHLSHGSQDQSCTIDVPIPQGINFDIKCAQISIHGYCHQLDRQRPFCS